MPVFIIYKVFTNFDPFAATFKSAYASQRKEMFTVLNMHNSGRENILIWRSKTRNRIDRPLKQRICIILNKLRQCGPFPYPDKICTYVSVKKLERSQRKHTPKILLG